MNQTLVGSNWAAVEYRSKNGIN